MDGMPFSYPADESVLNGYIPTETIEWRSDGWESDDGLIYVEVTTTARRSCRQKCCGQSPKETASWKS